jgi:hypothetical protein
MHECPMGYDELRAAIEGPAAKANLQFAPGIVDEMVKNVLGLDTALPLLQFALNSLWDHRDRNRISREVFKQVGPPLTALTNAADAFYAERTEDQAEIKRILLELVTIDRMMEAHRQPASRSALMATGSRSTASVLERLDKGDFVRVTPSRDGRDARVEVQHEALIRHWEQYVNWIAEKREQVCKGIALAEAAERWDQGGRSTDSGLLADWQLHDASRQTGLSALEQNYVQASADAIERRNRAHERDLLRQQKRRYVVVSVISVLTLVAVLAFAWTWRSYLLRQISEARAELAQAQDASYRGQIDHALLQSLSGVVRMRRATGALGSRLLFLGSTEETPYPGKPATLC